MRTLLALFVLSAAATVFLFGWGLLAGNYTLFGWGVVLLAVTLMVGARGNLS